MRHHVGCKTTKIIWYRGIIALCAGLFIAVFFIWRATQSAPLLANYYLGTLPTDSESIAHLARTDVLVVSPEQALTNRAVLDKIKQLNPKVILLAYQSTKSYNDSWLHYPANTLYKDFVVNDDWWLRDTSGGIVSNWPGLKSTNMSEAWSDYVIGFVRDKIMSQGIWDGVFWDEVYDGIATVNGGDIDLNRDGQRDDGAWANAEWVRRINYLLDKSRATFGDKYLVTNGSSIESMQKNINGRMYENYPTPWEAGGSWGGLMTRLDQIRFLNRKPNLYIFNANTNNTGKRTDYRHMRFGLLSSLLLDNVYYSFDFGDQNHAQVWWYDEYDVKLGDPVGEAQSLNNQKRFQDGVWRRDYTNGVALLNATNQSQSVDLGGEYEKIIGTQDPIVNNGGIVDHVTLGAQDGLILLKTFKQVNEVFFKNGTFMRFYRGTGARARNGFFVFENQYPGGAKIFHGDLNGDSTNETIVATGPQLEIFNDKGERWFSDYPFGGNFKGEINIAVGKVLPGNEKQIIVAPSTGGKIMVYDYHGGVLKDEWYPLGAKYKNGFSVAAGDFGSGSADVVLGIGKGRPAEIVVFSGLTEKVKKRFYPYGSRYLGGANLTVGDFDGNGVAEIAAVSTSGRRPIVSLFTSAGKKISSFTISGFFGSQTMTLGAADVNFEGKKEIVAMSAN